MGRHTVQGQLLAGGNGRETFFWGKEEAWKLLFSESLWLRRPHRSAGWGDNQLSIADFQGSGQFCSSRETVLPGTGTLQERKGLLSGIIMKKKGKDLYFFFGSFILGLILNLQKSCGNGIEFPYVYLAPSLASWEQFSQGYLRCCLLAWSPKNSHLARHNSQFSDCEYCLSW